MMVGSPFGNKKISNNASILFKKFISIARHIYDKNDGSWIGLSHGPPPPPPTQRTFSMNQLRLFFIAMQIKGNGKALVK